MSIVTYNNRSIANISAVPGAAESLTHIKTLTASSSATLSFVNGSDDVVLDSTYPIYVFKFINIHAQTDDTFGTFQASTDGGSNYNTTATTTFFQAKHDEADSATSLGYSSSLDFAQSTSFLYIQQPLGADADQSFSGTMHLFNPSSTTFVKHFISRINGIAHNDRTNDNLVAGYFNTTSAINAIQFKISSGNIDAGTIKLYGIKDS
tara:strand:- start:23 stop:643 length:621 start_codon:yes stop_codon:yes gene_type:complete